MIGRLKGRVDAYGSDRVLIDVGGVGYDVRCSGTTLQALPAVGEAATIHVETIVRENEITLYGFASEPEREWFRLLITVQGVGARVALGVLSTLKAADLASAIALGDKAMIARAPGVGPKVAGRIASELKDKGPALADADPAVASLQAEIGEGAASAPVADAVSALVNLGYGQAQAAAAVAMARKSAGEEADAGALIRQGLKELST